MKRTAHWLHFYCSIALASLACARVCAAATAPKDSSAFHRSVADTVTLMEPVDVNAKSGVVGDRSTRTSVRVDFEGASKFLPITVADALASVPGVDLVKTGPWASQLSLRGLSGDRVLLMVDGVRMNSVRGHGVQPSLISLDRLEAIELMPGASSAQYGSDALGGVVNVVTQRSLFSDRASSSYVLQARAADPGWAWSSAVRARITGPNTGIELSGGVGALDHLRTPLGPVDRSGYREQDYTVRVASRLGSGVFDLEHSEHAVFDAGLPAFSGLVVQSSVPPSSFGSYPLQRRGAQRLELTLPGSGSLPDFNVLGVHQRYVTSFDESGTDSVYLRGRAVGTTSNSSSDRVTTEVYSAEPSVRFRGSADLRLFGEYRYEHAEGPVHRETTTRDLSGQVTASSEGEGISVPPADRTAYAAGISGGHTWGRLRLDSSVRYDMLRSRADSVPTSPTADLDVTDRHTSVELGVSHIFGPVQPYAHAGTGFRAPNLDERYYNSTAHGGLWLFGNPDLESEHSRSYEIGIRAAGEHKPWLRSVRISAYRSDVDDLISFRYIGMVYLVPRFQYVNVQRARLEGIEAMAQFSVGSVRIDVSGALPRGRDLDTGLPLEDVSGARAALEIACPLPQLLPSGAITARVRWNDAIDGVSEVLRRPAFSTTSLEASAVLGGVQTVVAVRNLWNHFYSEPQSFIPEPGRTFALSVRREFRPEWPF